MEASVYKAGKIYTNDALYGTGSGAVVARDLFNTMLRNIARNSSLFFDVVGEHPFTYKERQFHSITFPALSKAASVAMLEQPMKRAGRRDNNRTNWLDYWVLHKDVVFLIEMKHNWISTNTWNLNRSVLSGWRGDINKLESVNIDDFVFEKPTVLRCSLCVIPAYTRMGKKRSHPITSFHESIELLEHVKDQFDPKPNWYGTWYLHNKLRDPVEYNDGKTEQYPCLLVLVRIF